MRGCVLYGRVVFSNPAKNRPAKEPAVVRLQSRAGTELTRE